MLLFHEIKMCVLVPLNLPECETEELEAKFEAAASQAAREVERRLRGELELASLEVRVCR